MDIQTTYQIIYTVLFVLAAVFLAAAVFVFFRFGILDAFEDLSGVKLRKKNERTTAKRSTKRSTGKQLSASPVTKPEPLPQRMETGSNTVYLDESQTVSMEDDNAEDPTAEMEKTADMTSTAGMTGAATVSLADVNEEARAALAFRSDVKIIVAQSMERI